MSTIHARPRPTYPESKLHAEIGRSHNMPVNTQIDEKIIEDTANSYRAEPATATKKKKKKSNK